jgi:hypothetical protein
MGSSTIAFHAAQAVHWPVHLACAAPHSIQVNNVAVLVMPATMTMGCHSDLGVEGWGPAGRVAVWRHLRTRARAAGIVDVQWA